MFLGFGCVCSSMSIEERCEFNVEFMGEFEDLYEGIVSISGVIREENYSEDMSRSGDTYDSIIVPCTIVLDSTVTSKGNVMDEIENIDGVFSVERL